MIRIIKRRRTVSLFFRITTTIFIIHGFCFCSSFSFFGNTGSTTTTTTTTYSHHQVQNNNYNNNDNNNNLLSCKLSSRRRRMMMMITKAYRLDSDSDDNDNDEDNTKTTTTTTTMNNNKNKKQSLLKTNPNKKNGTNHGSTTTSSSSSSTTKTYEETAEANRQRAIENKKKRESVQDKKRRLLMYMKKQQIRKKWSLRVKRPISLKERNLTLDELYPGMIITNGTVISITNFGAYVDIGTEIDGLLHISQLSRTSFIEHPKKVLQIGQTLSNIVIRSVSVEKKKMHLSLLPVDIVLSELKAAAANNIDNMDDNTDITPAILLNELQIDDELWGIITRITNYGAYVDVGAIVPGFLHFMDHPLFEFGLTSYDIMNIDDKIRIWVSNLDITSSSNPKNNRIKLTAIRPKHLPGPRRE